MPECPHGEDLRWCTWCKPARAEQIAKPFAYTGGKAIAEFEGECAHCGDEISPGDEIAFRGAEGGWCLLSHVHVWSPVETNVDLSFL